MLDTKFSKMIVKYRKEYVITSNTVIGEPQMTVVKEHLINRKM